MTDRKPYYVGWDVGGWNCEKNRRSRDAIAILDGDRRRMGRIWLGNLKELINKSKFIEEFIAGLFNLCGAELADDPDVTLAIDIPLGLPKALIDLATQAAATEVNGDSKDNRYLFRATERHLAGKDFKPLSTIKDMIGSQATKAMHVLAKYGLRSETCGVWTGGHNVRVIETYPTTCRKSPSILRLLERETQLAANDENDAFLCALVAWLFATHLDALVPPQGDVPDGEGWIWYPK